MNPSHCPTWHRSSLISFATIRELIPKACSFLFQLNNSRVHLVQPRLGVLLALVGHIRVVDRSLQASGTAVIQRCQEICFTRWVRVRLGGFYLHVVGVLALVRSGLNVSAVELVVQHIAGVLLGFLGSVGVVEVGLVAADDVAWVGHFECLVVGGRLV